MEQTITGETMGANPLREEAIREESAKEQIVLRSSTVEESVHYAEFIQRVPQWRRACHYDHSFHTDLFKFLVQLC